MGSIPDFLMGFINGLGNMVAQAMSAVFVLIFASLAAGPAIASTLLVPLSRRWPRLQQSGLLSGVTGVILTLVIIYLLVATAAVLDGRLFDLTTLSAVFPALSFVIVTASLWYQFANRSTFTTSRAVGIAAAILTPIVIIFAGP